MLMDIQVEHDSEHWKMKQIKTQQNVTNLFYCFDF